MTMPVHRQAAHHEHFPLIRRGKDEPSIKTARGHDRYEHISAGVIQSDHKTTEWRGRQPMSAGPRRAGRGSRREWSPPARRGSRGPARPNFWPKPWRAFMMNHDVRTPAARTTTVTRAASEAHAHGRRPPRPRRRCRRRRGHQLPLSTPYGNENAGIAENGNAPAQCGPQTSSAR